MPIDVHAHYVPPSIVESLESRARDFGLSVVKHPPSCECAVHFDYGTKVRPFFPKLIEPVEARFEGMGKQGVDRQVLSIWADIFGYGLPAEQATRWHRFLNEHMSALCTRHARQFSMLASVPLPHAAAAAAELEHAVKQFGAVGAVVAANVEGINLGEVDLDAFWQTAVDLDVGVFIHPVQAMAAPRTVKFALSQVAQYTVDTTMCIGSLIMNGVLDRFPKLRILLSHGGGTFPYLTGRFDLMQSRKAAVRVTWPSSRRRPISSASTTTRSCTIRPSCAGWPSACRPIASRSAATTRSRRRTAIRSAPCARPASRRRT